MPLHQINQQPLANRTLTTIHLQQTTDRSAVELANWKTHMDAHSLSIVQKYGMQDTRSTYCRKWDQHKTCTRVHWGQGYDCDCPCHHTYKAQPCTCHKWYRPQEASETPATLVEE